MSHRIVIVGGGFGGVTAALHLSKKHLNDTEIILISDKPNLEYYGVLWRLVGGAKLGEACIPLKAMLGKNVTVDIDAITSINAKAKKVNGVKAAYDYDTLILAPGSVPAYFNIPGMEEHSITMKSAEEALKIRRIIQSQKANGSYVIVGAGPTGIEIAGEIIRLVPAADVHLIEAMNRVLPSVEPKASAKVLKRLKDLKINVYVNTAVASADSTGITFKDGTKMSATTLMWTAGVKAHPLVSSIEGLESDSRGRATVDGQLRAKGQKDIFILGDCALTKFSGMAQTAHEDGKHVANVIAAEHAGKPAPAYKPVAPAYAIPVGPLWAAVKFGPLRVYGLLGYLMRRAADVHVYSLILPWHKVPAAFFGSIRISEYQNNRA